MTAAIGRFAPSPTSNLHLGNLRTALLTWLFAHDPGDDLDPGEMLLRIEDLDQQRVAAAPQVASQQLADLTALGLNWPQPVLRQSERLEIYARAAAELDTYECYCTRKEIAAASQAPHGNYRPYPGTCADLTPAERAERRASRPPAIRVRAGGAQFTVHDFHAGQVSGLVDDFVIFRNDGIPAYNLAAVVDDGLSGVTQVTRGADLLDSSPRQGWLADQLGFVVPRYVHVGLVVNDKGERLAKRDGGYDLPTLAARGVSVHDVVAMLAESMGMPAASDAADLLTKVRGTNWQHNPQIWQQWQVADLAAAL